MKEDYLSSQQLLNKEKAYTKALILEKEDLIKVQGATTQKLESLRDTLNVNKRDNADIRHQLEQVKQDYAEYESKSRLQSENLSSEIEGLVSENRSFQLKAMQVEEKYKKESLQVEKVQRSLQQDI